VDGWWDEIEREIRECLECHGTLTTAELAGHLRMSESATASLLRVLALNGDVQMSARLSREQPQRRRPNDPRRNAA
jgi:predicted ArsR family transcriptional regulator